MQQIAVAHDFRLCANCCATFFSCTTKFVQVWNCFEAFFPLHTNKYTGILCGCEPPQRCSRENSSKGGNNFWSVQDLASTCCGTTNFWILQCIIPHYQNIDNNLTHYASFAVQMTHYSSCELMRVFSAHCSLSITS